MDDLISIIIPMYNSQDFIGKLLESLINQTYKNLEIIVVNDGSTDNSLLVVEEFAKHDSRIKVITTKNGGVSRARNIGLENVKGEYFSFLDSDDYIDLDMYEKIISKMKEVNTDAIRINYVKEDEKFNHISQGNMLNLKNKILDKEMIRKELIPYMFENKIEAYTPLLFIKRELLDELKAFNEDIHMMEDLLFYLDLLLKVNDIYFLDYKSYHYIFRVSSNTKRRDKLMINLNDTLKVVKMVEEFLEQNNFPDSLYSQVYYIYSTMIVKYILRTFQKSDEYFLSYDELVDILQNKEIHRIINRVQIIPDNEYIKQALGLMQLKKYSELYKYAQSIKDIAI